MTQEQTRKDNLKSLAECSPEQRYINTQKAVETKRRKREIRENMSLIYGGFLKDKFDVQIDGKKKKVSGADYVNMIIKQILRRGDNVTVALLKEMREAMQGDTHNIEISVNRAIAKSPEDRAREYKKLMGFTDEQIDAEFEITE